MHMTARRLGRSRGVFLHVLLWLYLSFWACLPAHYTHAQVTGGNQYSGKIIRVYYLMQPGDTLPGIAARFYWDSTGLGPVDATNMIKTCAQKIVGRRMLSMTNAATGWQDSLLLELESLGMRTTVPREAVVADSLALCADRISFDDASNSMVAVSNVMFKSQFFHGIVTASEAVVREISNGVEVKSKNVTVYGSEADRQMTRTAELVEIFERRNP